MEPTVSGKRTNQLGNTLSVVWVLLLIAGNCMGLTARSYYLDQVLGNDSNAGTQDRPFKTIARLNKVVLNPGDVAYLKGGHTYKGTIKMVSSGNERHPIVLTSYGSDKATIDGGNGAAVVVKNGKYLTIKSLTLKGSGRLKGNVANGILIAGCKDIRVDDLDISGFQKSGVLIDSSSNLRVTNINAHDNGFSGIFVIGRRAKTDCRDIYIGQCRAENNPGDPTVLNNHSGNGILVGNCTNVLIEYCTATNNGWDMPRKGNGPVGIWAYEADRVVIQHCLSYRNKTSAGSADGGGFDLDGGVTNSIIQYCLSYENQGCGYGLFQYNGASDWHNNTIRYNISENDGAISTARAGIFIWNSSRVSSQLRDCYVYNNVIYNDRGAAISYDKESEHQAFHFFNNVFVGKSQLMIGRDLGNDVFLANNWYSLQDGFNMYGEKDFKIWIQKTGKEQSDGKIVGFNTQPKFRGPHHTMITSANDLKLFFSYQLPLDSTLLLKGLDLKKRYGINPGKVNFNEKRILPDAIGASF